MIEIWKLNRGDLFKIPGCDVILEFCGMDGAYAKCSTLTGQATLVGLCKVELVQGK
jgi:hypothetical protein